MLRVPPDLPVPPGSPGLSAAVGPPACAAHVRPADGHRAPGPLGRRRPLLSRSRRPPRHRPRVDPERRRPPSTARTTEAPGSAPRRTTPDRTAEPTAAGPRGACRAGGPRSPHPRRKPGRHEGQPHRHRPRNPASRGHPGRHRDARFRPAPARPRCRRAGRSGRHTGAVPGHPRLPRVGKPATGGPCSPAGPARPCPCGTVHGAVGLPAGSPPPLSGCGNPSPGPPRRLRGLCPSRTSPTSCTSPMSYASCRSHD